MPLVAIDWLGISTIWLTHACLVPAESVVNEQHVFTGLDRIHSYAVGIASR